MLVISDLGFQFAFLWWCVVVPAIAYVIRRRWKAAVARREEVRRLLALASEEADRAELEARYEYGKGYGNGNGNENGNGNRIGEVHRGVIDRDVSVYSSSNCAVCFRPTSRRCSRCKAVRYCSGECQIFHWRKGHKDECRAPMYSFQNDGVFLDSQHAVMQNNGGGDAVDLDSRGKQHGNLGIESSDNGFELNDSTRDIPPSGDEPFREKSNFPDGGFRNLSTSQEQNPSSSSTGKLTDGCSTEITIEKEPLKPELTTMVQAVDNHIRSDHKGDSDGRALENSGGASGNLLDVMVSSSQPNHNDAQQGVKTDVLRSNSNRSIVNGDVSKSRSDLPISFDFSQNLSSELYSQGLKGLFPYESFVKLYNWNKVELLPSGLLNCGNRYTLIKGKWEQ